MINPRYLLGMKEVLWPDVWFYDKQVEIIKSTCLNRETYAVAGNKLGKDFVTGFIPVGVFLACIALGKTCRIVTTSVAEHHLKVLWGEIGRFISTSRVPLLAAKGGPLVVNYQEIRRADEATMKNPLSYLVGRVSAKGEGLAGHHAEVTLGIGDEASGLAEDVYKMMQGWAQHMLFIGNPNPTTNFFYRGVKAGDMSEEAVDSAVMVGNGVGGLAG